MRLVIATRNPEKREELETLLADLDVKLLTLCDFPDAPDVVEDGATFRDNARKKAHEIALFTGLHAMADDSGLCVDALDGRPGVRSARYAGPDPTGEKLCSKLLREMEGIPAQCRAATFHCCAALARPDGSITFTVCGKCRGRITEQMSGDHGFGYDPVFVPEQSDRTFAEMEPEAKHSCSHRGHALKAFRSRFVEYLRSQSG